MVVVLVVVGLEYLVVCFVEVEYVEVVGDV